MIGRLTLVGAGPGDPELITLKGVKALENADIVLYDALVNQALLKHIPDSARKIFVGKRRGCYAFQQDEINDLIVQYAISGHHVVRLKGGDPFVFGRGAEEMAYVSKFGIKSSVIPGISSSFSVPALENIPMTKRNVAESVWVITGTTKHHKLSDDIQLAAQSSATVVILMGMSKLQQIADIYQSLGREDLPVAVIQNGTLPTQRLAISTMEHISTIVEKRGIQNPAIIVIGEVVNHRQEMQQIIQEAIVTQVAC
jgi:uroporphyrin-III C-methyltransferase